MNRLTVLIVLVLVFLAPPLSAQEAEKKAEPAPSSLDQELKWIQAEAFVWSASKTEQKVSEAPSLVTIVRSEDIRKFGYRTLGDVLRSLSGFFIFDQRSYQYVGVRGFGLFANYNSRVLFLVDGHKINEIVYEQGFVGMDFPLDIDLIDRIEVTRGPGSCLFGTNAFFGVINIITKKAQNVDGIEMSGKIGTLDTYQGRLTYGKEYKSNMGVLASATIYDSGGNERLYYREYDDPSTNNGYAEHLDGEESHTEYFKLSLPRDFTVAVVNSVRKRDIPTGSWESEFNARHDSTDKRAYFDLNYDHTFGRDTHVSYSFSYDYYNYESYGLYYTEEGELYPYRDDDLGKWLTQEFHLTRKWSRKNTLTAGAEHQYALHQDFVSYYGPPYDEYDIIRNSSTIWAMFFQDELRVREDLLLTGGVRYDHYPSFGGTVNPRLALIYHPLDQTNFKFIYGRAFRAPNTYEVLREDVDLGPEKIKTFEVVYQQSHGKNLQGYISGFYYKIDGLITEVPSEYAFLYRNAEDIHAQGLESEVQARWSHGVRGSVNYTFADVTRESDQILPNSPRHLMKGNFVFPLVSEKMFLSATGQYMSSRKSRDGNKVEPYFLMDAVLGVNIGKKLEGSLGIYNLLDKTYYDPGSDTHRQQLIQQNGRTLLVKVTYAF